MTVPPEPSMNTRKSRAALLSLGSNSLLVATKLSIGWAIGSVSIFSEAIHSGLDLVAAVIALWAVRASAKPADREHPFGHGKFENLSGAIEALLIFAAAGWIIIEAIERLAHPKAVGQPGLGLLIMLVSAVLNHLVSQNLFRVGKDTDSIALIADGWHLRTDVYTSLGVAGGMVLLWLGNRLDMPALVYADPVVALAVALLVLKAAGKLTVGSVRDLLDERLPDAEIAWIETYLSRLPDVEGYHDLRTRKAGAARFVEIHIELPSTMTVRDSHEITRRVSSDIRGQFPAATVTVHVDPSDSDVPSSHPRAATPIKPE